MGEDYAIQFERIAINYLGASIDNTYYATYYGDNFPTRALLFAICYREIHCKPQDDDKQKLIRFKEKFESGTSLYGDCLECLKFLHSKL